MKTWDDYKKYVKTADESGQTCMEEMEALAKIISAVIQQRHYLGMSQRELAALCGIPQSSIARIESLKVTPNLGTFLRIARSLGLTVNISAVGQTK